MSERRVVVTGIGIVSPLGNDRETTWKNALAGKSGVSPITHFDIADYPSRIAGQIKDLVTEPIVSAKEVRRLDRYSVIALMAAHEAWGHAKLEGHGYERSRMGVILGVGIGGLDTLEKNHTELEKNGPRRVSPFLIPGMIANIAPGHVAIAYDLQGVNYTITSACTSGTHAVGEAFRMVRDGLQDVVLTGGSEAAITPLALSGFGRMGALSTRNDEPEKASRPFDKDRDGFVIGEAAAVLVLEELEAAKRRGANIICEVVGYGFSCDAHHITAPVEGGRGAVICMKNALQNAKLAPNAIQYVNAHGTSTPINDPAETAAIKEVFGTHAKKGLMVSSTKSMTGHALGAAGGLEAAFIALSVERGQVPPTINLDNPDEGCDLDYVPHKGRDVPVQAAMSNSFGFGGTNASVIVKRV